jgi:hypothetical protein
VDLADLDPGVELSTPTVEPGDEHLCALAVITAPSPLLTSEGYNRESLSDLGRPHETASRDLGRRPTDV